MRRLAVVLPLLLLMGCSSTPGPTPLPTALAISCQPYGYTPAPIPFSFAPGPVTAAAAEQTALAMVRSCMQPYSISATAQTKTATGQKGDPNEGQAVWLVTIDGFVSYGSPSPLTPAHWMIEVNQATGVPTLVAYG